MARTPGPGEADATRREDDGSWVPCADCRSQETLDALPVGFFRTTLDGSWRTANATLARMLGFGSVGDLTASVRDVARDLYARPRDREEFREQLDRSGRVQGFEVELRRRDGGTLWCSVSARLVRARDGSPVSFEGVIEDVGDVRRAREELLAARSELERRVLERTAELERANRALAEEIREREEAERELRDSEERYRALAQHSQDVIMRFDREGRHLYVNASVEAVTGIPPSSYLGRTHREMGFPPDLVDVWEPAIEAVFRDGKANRVEFQLPGGTWIDWLLMPELAVDGSVQSVVTAARDITDRKRAEDLLRAARDELEVRVAERTEELRRTGELLRESEKMRALGVLAGGIAHDFNNLLQALLGATGLLRRRREDEQAFERVVDQLEADIGRGSALSRQLLLFARRERARMENADLNGLLRACGHLLSRLVRDNVALRFEPSASELPVRIDSGQIEQVLVNLVLNACDAIAGSGRITIRSGAGESGGAWFEVEDTGEGIDRANLPRIFEPFFTTKGRGKGTGLGLSVVHGIVDAHQGRLDVETAPGRGATFRVLLPAASGGGGATVEPARAAPGAARRGSGRVLVVEDEPAALRAIVSMLEGLGYDAVGTGSGEDVERLAAGSTFDVLVTDYMLPGLNGADLAVRLRERWPGLRVLVASGYVEDEAALLRLEHEGIELLRKPFDAPALGAALARILARPPTAG